MEKVALSSVGPGMMLLDTSPVASEGRSYATLAGRGNIVLNVSGVFLTIPTFLAEAVWHNIKTGHCWGMKRLLTSKLIFKFSDSCLWERSLQNELYNPTFTGGDVYTTLTFRHLIVKHIQCVVY